MLHPLEMPSTDASLQRNALPASHKPLLGASGRPAWRCCSTAKRALWPLQEPSKVVDRYAAGEDSSEEPKVCGLLVYAKGCFADAIDTLPSALLHAALQGCCRAAQGLQALLLSLCACTIASTAPGSCREPL